MSTSTAKQSRIIAELLQGKRLEQAAAAAGIAYSTARRWSLSPEFQAELAAARRAAIAEALDALTAAARSAALEQVRLLTDESTSPALRLKASIAILDRLTAWIELSDLEARLAALEAAQEAHRDA